MDSGQTIRKRGRPFKDASAFRTSVPPENGIYYTTEEAVSLLGIHRHTLQTRLRDGTLKAKKIGSEWRIYKDTLYVPEQDKAKGDYA